MLNSAEIMFSPEDRTHQPIDQPCLIQSASQKTQNASANTKNQRWTSEQHILYLIFLDLNKEKIKSKFIRRSNAFFREMSSFLKTKTTIQCRSHHQKYQQKYKFPHRIIKAEKDRMPTAVFQSVQRRLLEDQVYISLKNKIQKQTQAVTREKLEEKKKRRVNVACQTEIQDTQQYYYTVVPEFIHNGPSFGIFPILNINDFTLNWFAN